MKKSIIQINKNKIKLKNYIKKNIQQNLHGYKIVVMKKNNKYNNKNNNKIQLLLLM
jgi:hypothetical protein